MRRVSGLTLRPGESEERLLAMAAGELGAERGALLDFRILKKSLDARRRPDIRWVYTVGARLAGDPPERPEYAIPRVADPGTRPAVVGFGPAGMFAALVLARAGARPVVLERGPDALTRRARVEAFRAGGELDGECSVQFGEGGAGTFSDGKLNTGTRDERIKWVLEELYAHGAPESVTYDAKPHVGTDVLIDVVQRIREEVLALGGEVRFRHKMTGLETEGGAVRALRVASPQGEYLLPCRRAVAAVGHSARDTFEMLLSSGVPMEPKAFSMGARIEHRQSDIDLSQYGRARGRDLPPADYALSVRREGGDGVYTFCMCPGGYVIAAASEAGGVVTNGMSYSGRAGENANSAVLVTVGPEDFPYTGPLGGMYWQREIERRAFELAGGYLATSQRVGDFLARRPSEGPGRITPSYLPGVRWGELGDILPPRVTQAMVWAIPELGRKLRGFDLPDAVLTGPETRSSSPVRIPRDGTRQCAVSGLYPCGEGAGWAGGITSAAVDGVRCAEAVLESYEKL